MKIKSLTLKPKLKDENDDDYLDLSSSSFQDVINVQTLAIYMVDSFTEMRPDLISIKYYGSTEYVDIILKANNIFNPFSIKEGDYLVIPRIDDDTLIYKNNTNKKESPFVKQFIDTKRMSSVDKDRVDRLLEKAKGKNGAVEVPLPPNVLQPNETSTVINNGEIILGANLNIE